MPEGPPFITTDQMREVDRLMFEEFGVTLLQMMENAGRALARLARQRFLGGEIAGKHVVVLAGRGGNGGGGLACARNLHNWGAEVTVYATAPSNALESAAAHQARALSAVGVPTTVVNGAPDLPLADLVVDALVGYGLSGAARGATATLIRAVNDSAAPILSLDVPSGLDATTGEVHEPAVRATATMTLALPKTGLRAEGAAQAVGELYLADIGVPPELYRRPPLSLRVPDLFASHDIVKLS